MRELKGPWGWERVLPAWLCVVTPSVWHGEGNGLHYLLTYMFLFPTQCFLSICSPNKRLLIHMPAPRDTEGGGLTWRPFLRLRLLSLV